MNDQAWDKLLRSLRAGSRTVLYCPDVLGRVIALARRGFRVFVVHEEDSFLKECREQLRAQGLSSQMMGAYQLSSDERRLSLAKDFYDLFLAFEPLVDSRQAEECLAQGGRLVVVS